MQNFFKLGIVFILIFLGSFLREPSVKKASRQIASVGEVKNGIEFLYKKEIFLLTSYKQASYLRNVSKIITNAKSFGGVVENSRGTFLSEAWALVTCPIEGLMPMKKKTKEDCNKKPVGVSKVDVKFENKFQSSSWIKTSSGAEFPGCPIPKFMCNPVLVGFDFDSNGAAKVRCLDKASNENCSKLETNEKEINKSLELLEEINPNFWEEFTSGVKELCSNEVELLEQDPGCKYIRKHMSQLTKKYRKDLNKKYTNFSDFLENLEKEQKRKGVNTVCKSHVEDMGNKYTNTNNFNTAGQKIVMTQHGCYRVPYDSVIHIKDGKYKFFQMDKPDEEDFFSLKRTAEKKGVIVVSQEGHDVKVKKSGDRFYSFKCGPCNDALDIKACAEDLQRSEANKKGYQKLQTNKGRQYLLSTNMDYCKNFIKTLTSQKIPEVILKKFKGNADNFRSSTGSIQ